MSSQPARPPFLAASQWMRASYWWYFAGMGCLLPYVALYYRQLGFSGTEIGVLSTVSPVAVAVCAPYWGALADSRGAHRLLLRCGLVSAGLLALLLSRASDFWQILLINLGMGIATSAIPALLDSYGVMIAAQQNSSYGQLRLWGSVSYSAASWLIGLWMGSAVSAAFLLAYAAAALLALGTTFGLPPRTLRTGAPPRGGLGSLLRQPGLLVLLGTMFVVAVSTGIVFNYFGIYVAALGGSAQLVGTLTALGAFAEMPVLLLGAGLFRRFTSVQVLVAAVALYCLRFAIYTVVPSADWLLPVQLLHGVTFGCYLMASVTLAFELAGPERATTAQGLINSVTYGFGAISGALIGGVLLDQIGIIPTVRVATGLMLAALGLLLAGQRFARRTPQTGGGTQ